MIGFIVGSMLGGTVGITTMCLLQAAGRADEYMERSELQDTGRLRPGDQEK